MRSPLSFLVICLLVASCSRKEGPGRDHRLPEPVANTEVTQKGEVSSPIYALYKNRANVYENVIESNNVEKAEVLLNQYFDSFINEYFYSITDMTNSETTTVTDLINSLILMVSDPEPYLTRLEEEIFKQCDDNLRYCPHLGDYPIVHSSSRVMLLLSLKQRNLNQGEFNVKAAARLFHALKISRGAPSPDLYIHIVRNKESIEDLFDSNPYLKNQGGNFVSEIQDRVRSRGEKDTQFRKEYCEGIFKIDVIIDLENRSESPIAKSSIIENLEFCFGYINNFEGVFAGIIEQEIESGDESSFFKRYFSQDSKFYQRFDLPPNPSKDITLYAIDRYYKERISVSVAKRLIEFGGKSDLYVLQTILNYSRMVFALSAHEIFETFFKELRAEIKLRSGLGPSSLVKITSKTGDLKHKDWVEIGNSLKGLREFSRSVFSNGLEGEEEKGVFEKIDRSLTYDSVLKSIKEEVEQPLQLVLLYYLTFSKGQVKFHLPWSPLTLKHFEVKGEEGLRDFVNAAGTIAGNTSLFQLNHVVNLNNSRAKVHGAIYRVMKYGLASMASFDVKKIVSGAAFSEEENARLLLLKIMDMLFIDGEYKNRSESLRDARRDFLNFNEYGLKQVKSFCENPFDDQAIQAMGYLRQVVSVPYIENLVSLNKAYQAQKFLLNIPEWSEWLRERERIERFAKLVSSSLGSTDEVDKFESAIRKRLKYLEKPRIELHKLAKRIRRILFKESCFRKVALIERYRTRALFYKFNRFLEEIYFSGKLTSALVDQNLQSSELSVAYFENQIKSVEDQTNFKRPDFLKDSSKWFQSPEVKIVLFGPNSEVLPPQIKVEDLVNLIQYSLNTHNSLTLRDAGIGVYIRSAPSSLDVKSLDLDGKLEIFDGEVTFTAWDLVTRLRHWVFNSDLSEFSELSRSPLYKGIIPSSGKLFPKVDNTLKAVNDLSAQYNDLSSSKYKVRIPLSVDYEVFKSQALQTLFGEDQGDFIHWFSPNKESLTKQEGYISTEIRVLTRLYKFGPFPLSSNWNEDCFEESWPENYQNSFYFTPSCTKTLRVEPKTILKTLKRYAKDISLRDEDYQFIADLSQTAVLGRRASSRAFSFKKVPSQDWRLFDGYYVRFIAGEQDHGTGIQRNVIPLFDEIDDFSDEVEDDFQSVRKLFSYPQISSLIRADLRRVHFDKLQRLIDFEDAAQEFELNDKRPLVDIPLSVPISPKADERLSLPEQVSTLPARWNNLGGVRVIHVPVKDGVPEYFSQEIGPSVWFWGDYKIFHSSDQTNCFLLPEKGDPDYVWVDQNVNNASCLNRLERYVEKLRVNKGLRGVLVESNTP